LKTCYLSKPPSRSAGVLIDIIKSNEFKLSADLESENVDFYPQNIKQSDVFIGVLNGTRSDYRILHEAGIALGLEKPVALIVNPERDLAFDLLGCTVIRARLNERHALDIHLSAFLAAPRESVFTLKREKLTSSAPQSDRFALRSYSSPNFNSAAEHAVYSILASVNVHVISQPNRDMNSEYRPDFIAKIRDSDGYREGMLAIEVKGAVSEARAIDVEEKLYKFLMASGLKTGLIIAPTATSAASSYRSGSIFWLTISEFARLVGRGELGKHLRSERNRLMHGGS
jgi:hypothetical protein